MTDKAKALFFSNKDPEGRWVPVEGDQLRAGVTEILYQIDADLEELGWDLPPMLFWLYRIPVEMPPESWPPGGEGPYAGFAFHVRPVPIPDSLWIEAQRPVNLLFWLVDQMQEMFKTTQITAGDELMAYIFAVEAWMVKAHDMDEAGKDDLVRQGKEHNLHEHPDRVETRIISAVDTAGEKYYLAHERDGIVEEIGGDDSRELDGGVYDALTELLATSRGEVDPRT